MKKKLLALLMASLLAFAVVGCGDNSSAGSAQSSEKIDDNAKSSLSTAIKTSLMDPNVVSDAAFKSPADGEYTLSELFDACGTSKFKLSVEEMMGGSLDSYGDLKVVLDGVNITVK